MEALRSARSSPAEVEWATAGRADEVGFRAISGERVTGDHPHLRMTILLPLLGLRRLRRYLYRQPTVARDAHAAADAETGP